MALDLTAFREEVNAATGTRDDLTTARIDRALNLTQERVARSHRWEELQSLQAGTLTFSGTLATDKFLTVPAVRKVYSFLVIHVTDEKVNKLIRLSQPDWDKKIGVTNFFSTNMPTHYIKFVNKFEMFPIIDKEYTYEIRADVWATALTTASQNSDLDRKDDILISGAVSYLFTTLRMLEDAGRWFNIYRNQLISAGVEQDTNPDLVQAGMIQDDGLSASNYWQDPFVKQVS